MFLQWLSLDAPDAIVVTWGKKWASIVSATSSMQLIASTRDLPGIPSSISLCLCAPSSCARQLYCFWSDHRQSWLEPVYARYLCHFCRTCSPHLRKGKSLHPAVYQRLQLLGCNPTTFIKNDLFITAQPIEILFDAEQGLHPCFRCFWCFEAWRMKLPYIKISNVTPIWVLLFF